MSRYDRYSMAAVQLMKDTKARAKARNSPVMDVCDLVRWLCEPPGNVFATFAEKQGLEWRLPDIVVLPPRSAEKVELGDDLELIRQPLLPGWVSTDQQIELGDDLRRLLDRAESRQEGEINCRHLIIHGWEEFKGYLALCLYREGRLISKEVLGWTDSVLWEILPPLPVPAVKPVQPVPVQPVQKIPPLDGILARFGRDLTSQEHPQPVIGRIDEIDALVSILVKALKPNAILLGEAGVGKTALVEGLVARIREGSVPKPLQGKRIVEITPCSILADTSMHGEFEKRMKEILDQAEKDPDIILFVDEMHALMGHGGSSRGRDMPDILKPALSRGTLRMIGATTRREYQASIARDPAFSRRFQILHVGEPDLLAVTDILSFNRPKMESHHGISVPEGLNDLIIDLARTELPFRKFPDKAIDVLDRACAEAVIAGDSSLEARHMRKVVASLAGVNLTRDSADFHKLLTELEDKLNERVIGQKPAVEATSNVVRLCKRGLDLRPERPDGVFLFVGPTGTGKTELARTLHQLVTGTKSEPIRLDMTSFTEAYSVSQVIGSPPGYVGYDVEPSWLGQLAMRPSGVLLLDEFEKAHPDVQRVFLRAFDEGRIEDARGDMHSLSNTTIIATSNVVPRSSAEAVGFHAGPTGDRTSVTSRLEGLFPTELLNRFDEIIEFQPLAEESLIHILRHHIVEKRSRILRYQYNIGLELSEQALLHLVRMAEPTKSGAGELKRVFEKEIILPVLKQYAQKKKPPECVHVSVDGTQLVFQ